MINPLIFICFISPFFFSTQVLVAVDSLYPNQSILDNGGTLISASQTFELGFFSPWNSNNRYIGIWFKNVPIQTVVWVANRDDPVTDSSGVITITTIGNIIISSNQTNIIWNSNSSSTRGTNPVLQLLDSGNLVLRNINSDNYFWQSFDHPRDTLIPGMELGWNLKTNQEWYLTSWRSSEDPATGGYTYRLNPHGLPEIVLRLGSRVQFRSGPWDGVRFGGSPKQSHNSVLKPIYVFDEENAFYAFQNYDVSIISRFVLNQSGMVQFLTWRQRRNEWVVIATMQEDICDNYAQCGNHGVCTLNGNPICDCLDGFVPRLPQDWERQDWSGGCYRRTPLNCSATEGFKKFSNLKLPDNSNFLVNSTSVSTPVECEEACLRNCSCTAYAVTEVSVCAVWFGDLVDIRTFSEDGQDIYIRMPASELVESSSDRAKRTALIASVTVVVFILGLIIWYVLRKRNIAKERDMASQRRDIPNPNNYQSIGEEDLELPLFDLLIISAATNDFCLTNKIGEGGFGLVYKGILSTGQEIAVKRLSKDSGQGLEEFKNEVILIAKLQHRNLVRLLGCCIHGDERMLIYEHMPNKSLDLFIFDRTRAMILDWAKRLNIIVGIARGLLYLHRDSRLRIIHRDLKVSNILLDGEMNPKISDFGLARIFGGDKFQENTSRIMGTYGYMSPEYAIDGLFSVKSDVFSFGVLTLEIVSGNKNRGFYHPDHDLNLLGHAWRIWNDGNALNLVDASMGSSFLAPEVLRCIHVGLLCVQQRPEDRPTMSNVLLMLDVEYPLVPQPKQPGFYLERSFTDTDSSSTGKRIYTPNEVTLTQLQGR